MFVWTRVRLICTRSDALSFMTNQKSPFPPHSMTASCSLPAVTWPLSHSGSGPLPVKVSSTQRDTLAVILFLGQALVWRWGRVCRISPGDGYRLCINSAGQSCGQLLHRVRIKRKGSVQVWDSDCLLSDGGRVKGTLTAASQPWSWLWERAVFL